jgi:hypothetical protein
VGYKKPITEESQPPAETPPAEDTPKETPPEKPEPPKEVVTPDKVKIASELFGQEFENEEKVTETIRSLREWETKYTQAQQEIDELKAGIDPRQFFVSDAELERQLLLKQFPQYDPVLITKVIAQDLAKMADVDAIRLHHRLTAPEIYQSDEDVDLLLKKELGIDSEESIVSTELDRTTQLQIKKMARDARNEFGDIRSKIKLPEKIDLKAKKAEADAATKARQDKVRPICQQALQGMPAKLDKLEFTHVDPETKQNISLYEHSIEDSFRKEVQDVLPHAVEMMVKSGKDYTVQMVTEELNVMIGRLKQKYLVDNVNKIMFAFMRKLEKQFADKEHEEAHNPQKPNLQEAPQAQKTPAQLSKEKAEADILKAHGRA